jgi:hypothetical protein
MLKIVGILVFAVFLIAQNVPVPVIELTNTVVLQRLREPTTASASGNSIGYQGGIPEPAPINLELISLTGSQSDKTSVLIGEFQLRNVSGKDMDIPVDPSSRDLEPTSPATPYRYLKAYIWLSAEPGAKEGTPSTGLFLYGAKAVPMSLRTLKPGQAVRIRARIPASSILQNAPDTVATTSQAKSIRAFFALYNESITPQHGGLHSNTQELFPTISSSTTAESPL